MSTRLTLSLFLCFFLSILQINAQILEKAEELTSKGQYEEAISLLTANKKVFRKDTAKSKYNIYLAHPFELLENNNFDILYIFI